MGNFDAQALDVLLEGIALLSVADEAEGAEAIEIGEGEVFAGRMRENQALGFTVFGDQADATADCIFWRAGIERTTVEGHVAGVAAIGAEDQAGYFGPACADQSGEAKH